MRISRFPAPVCTCRENPVRFPSGLSGRLRTCSPRAAHQGSPGGPGRARRALVPHPSALNRRLIAAPMLFEAAVITATPLTIVRGSSMVYRRVDGQGG